MTVTAEFLSIWILSGNPCTMKLNSREYLGIYIYTRPKNEIEKDFNNEILSKAEVIRCIRVQAIVNKELGFLIALKEYFSGKATVLSPDLPLHPQKALDFIQRLYNQEQPDILIRNSNGSFLAQIIASKNNIPALLGNPNFEMTRFLMERIG